MKPKRKYGDWVLPIGAALLLWGVAFSMACRLEGNRFVSVPIEQSFLERVLGVSRVAFGQTFFEQADLYFHQGVGYVRQQAFTNSVFIRAYEVIRPSAHAHTTGYTVSEILPWLQFTTRMDPKNVTAYLTTAYWLRSALRRPDLAEQVLLEAQRKNPYDYRVYNERARIAFQRRDDSRAARLLDAALKVWPSNEDPEDEQTLLDLSVILSRQAILYEMKGERDAALALFRKVVELRPGNVAVARRVEAMEQGMDYSHLDRKTWDILFGGTDKPVHVCGEGDDHDHDHDHDHNHDCEHHHHDI